MFTIRVRSPAGVDIVAVDCAGRALQELARLREKYRIQPTVWQGEQVYMEAELHALADANGAIRLVRSF
jgi:hypothetical protein